ncbi:hypothetical protein ACP4OV_025257 [Aristida adscensionis]
MKGGHKEEPVAGKGDGGHGSRYPGDDGRPATSSLMGDEDEMHRVFTVTPLDVCKGVVSMEEAMAAAATTEVITIVVPPDDTTGGSGEEHDGRSGSLGGAPEADEGPSMIDLALFAYSGSVMLGLLADGRGALDTWAMAPKLAYGTIMVVTVASTGVGFLAAGCRASPIAKNTKLSAFCARFGSIAATTLLVVAVACKLGCSVCVAGVPSAVVIDAVMVGVWIKSEPAAAEAIVGFWARLWEWKREEPVACSPV